MTDHTEHFSRDELKCTHCGKCFMDEFFMKKIESARVLTGFPWIVNSAYRCTAYDAEIGGEGNHPTGMAMDIHFDNSSQLYELIFSLRGVGITRFGISFKGKFLHADMVVSNPTRVIWGYV